MSNQLIVRKPKKPRKKDYPANGTLMARYAIRNGKWGDYFWDNKTGIPLDFRMVQEKLNRLELRTKQLRWYVERFGEVQQ